MLPLFAVIFVAVVFFVDWKRSRCALFDYLVLRITFIYSRLWHRFKTNRIAPFPLGRPCLVVSNHTCSSDPVLILAGSPFPIGFVVAKEHYNLHPLARRILDALHCVPVVRGGCDPLAVRRILRTLERGRVLALFPEGNLSNVRHERVGSGKQGIGYLALKTRLPVFPVFIDGGPRTDELLASWLLPAPRPARVFYGPAVDLSAFTDRPLNRKLIAETTDHIMEQIRSLDPKRHTQSPSPLSRKGPG